MNIAIYYPWIYLTSGIERTILETLKLPGHTFTIYTHHYDRQNTFPEFTHFQVVELKRVPIERHLLSVLKAAYIITTQKLDLQGFDLLIVHSDGLADLILTRNQTIPTLCICHTPLRPVFDPLYVRHLLKSKSILYRPPFYLFSRTFKLLDQLLWPRYSKVLFNSRETLNRAQAGGLFRRLQKNQLEVLHPGVDWSHITPSRTFKPYFLLPGRIMWTKHIKLAILAFIRFKQQHPQHQKFSLVIAGRVDHKSQSYLETLKQLAHRRSDIQFILNPTDTELSKLYHSCYAVLSSAFNEDWGLTLIEANAHAKPVIAINRGGPTESQIDGQTGLLVPPTPKAFAHALYHLASNPQLTQELSQNARRHSKQYDWTHYQHILHQQLTQLTKPSK